MNTNDHLADDCSQSTERIDGPSGADWQAVADVVHGEVVMRVDADRLPHGTTLYIKGNAGVAPSSASRDAEVQRLREALEAFMGLDKSFSTTCDVHLNDMAETSPMARAVKLARAALQEQQQ